ncbi:tetratricopeptide repeat protein [Candidatus Nomurabacteria bacterium]|nr:tetratricopeptide repeat protein [Candidatus Nomurabacteria bacterium]
MSGSPFTPKIKQVVQTKSEDFVEPQKDVTSSVLIQIAQYMLILFIGLVPLFFVPGLWASLGFSKVLLAMVVSVVTVISLSLLMLRRKFAKTVWPMALSFFWGLVLISLISGLISGDIQDSIRGSVMESQTVGFLFLMALSMTIPLVLQGSKVMTIKALASFGLMATLLIVYNVLRLILGADFLAFSSFNALTVSPIGGFNDLAIFAGLTVIFGLVTLAQLPLRVFIQYAISVLIIISLVVLAVVNFFYIWIIIGFFGLLLFVYLLSRDTLFRSSEDLLPLTKMPRSLIVTTLIVCVVSAVFIVAGEYAGGKVSEITDVNYVEVRPSFSATIDIANGVYKEDLLFGAGPNRFADVWRKYKDPSINETIFWDTDFIAGSGYIPTLFVSLGALGGVMVILFHLYFIFVGYKMLLRGDTRDFYWYYFGVVSFTSAVFLWLMSYIYVPGEGILLLTALFTGLSFVAYGALVPGTVRTFPLAVNRQRGFVLMAAIIFVITVSVGSLLTVGKQYLAEARFNESQATADSTATFEQVALTSFGLYPDDRFVSTRAQVHLATLNTLLNVAEPGEEEIQKYKESSAKAITLAEQAVAKDLTNPDNYAVLAAVYSNIAIGGGGTDAQDRANTALKKAQELDPLNPGYHLLAAQMLARAGEVAMAREEINAALNLKRNYTEALFLLAQIDISEGKTESAIATTRAIINLEPNNPTRYFQLGVLLASNENLTGAIEAYKAAIKLDNEYANARYMLALALVNTNQQEAALEQLKFVQKTNGDNDTLNTLIQQVENGETIPVPSLGVGAKAPVKDTNENTIKPEDLETDLINSVNTISESQDNQAEVTPVIDMPLETMVQPEEVTVVEQFEE